MFCERRGFLFIRSGPGIIAKLKGRDVLWGVFHFAGRFPQRITGVGSWRQVGEVSFDSVISEGVQDKFEFLGQFVVVKFVLRCSRDLPSFSGFPFFL